MCCFDKPLDEINGNWVTVEGNLKMELRDGKIIPILHCDTVTPSHAPENYYIYL